VISERCVNIVSERGPLTVAAFMDLALYDPELGYYARAAGRSGRAGDFFTSVDVGPLFGELLAVQIAELADILEARTPTSTFDLVEAGAGSGRLAADVLRALTRRRHGFLDRVRLSLVDASLAARAAQAETLRGIFDRPFTSSESVPDGIEGVVFANELLDALPVHQVVMREDGLKEVYVCSADVQVGHASSADLQVGDARRVDLRSADLLGPPPLPQLRIREGPVSTPALAEYLDRLHVALEPGWRAEINLRAVEWVRDVARRLRRGFVILIDYGHEARELYSASHAAGTLTTFTRHASGTPAGDGSVPAWLDQPGDQDITAHVDFTSVRAAAEAEGLTTIGFLDQTYFILGLIGAQGARTPALSEVERPAQSAVEEPGFRERLALKTLLMPGGLGSTMKVLILGKDVGHPALAGCSYRVRVT
jgi:SAM-dependent MidA family methyltransferase